jgi:dUTP pyrophosphatase
MDTLKVYKLLGGIETPKIATQGSACFDIPVNFNTNSEIKGRGLIHLKNGKYIFSLPPQSICLIPTGYIFDIPKGYHVKMYVRSSTPLKTGLILANSVGIIDSDYVHEVIVQMYNTTDRFIEIESGTRLCQGGLVKNNEITIETISEKPVQKTDRKGGFGSTGK